MSKQTNAHFQSWKTKGPLILENVIEYNTCLKMLSAFEQGQPKPPTFN